MSGGEGRIALCHGAKGTRVEEAVGWRGGPGEGEVRERLDNEEVTGRL